MNKTTTTVRTRPDRTLEQKTDSGWIKIEIPKSEFVGDVDHPAYDPDNMPLTPERLSKMRRISKAKFVRRKLGLSQEQFADLYQIPIGTLRDWEQHRTEPDATAKAYLKVIAADPEKVAAMLRPKVVAAE